MFIRGCRSSAVADRFRPGGVPRAVRTAIERGVDLDPVPEDPHTAALAAGGHDVRGALEAVEHAAALALGHGDRLVVVVATGIAGSHRLHRRSEEHTSELQSRGHLVCRLLLEKKK